MSLLGHDKRTVKSWKAAPEERSLEATAKDGQWRCWRDVLRKTVPDTRGGDRKSSVTDGWQSVTMPRWNADDIELRCLLAGRVRRRGTTVLHLADTCRQGEPACNQSAPAPSTNVVDGGVGWCARTSTRKTPAEQQNSSPTEAASAGTAECRREWHFRDPAASDWVTHQRLENGSRNGPANASQLTQNGEAGRDGLRNVWPHLYLKYSTWRRRVVCTWSKADHRWS